MTRTWAAVGSAAVILALAGCDLGAAPTVYPHVGGTVADFDGDGHVDMITVHDDRVAVLAGDGAGGFDHSETPGNYFFADPYRRQFADVNGDGRDDFVVEWGSDPVIVDVLLNDGAGGFGPSRRILTYPGEAYSSLVTWLLTDVNSDGNQDFVLHRIYAELSVRLGDGTGAFGAPIASPPPTDGIPIGGFEAVDVDGDGHLDLVTSGPTVLWGDGAGSFPTSGSFDSIDLPDADGLSEALGVRTGDVDGDGLIDLIDKDFVDSNSEATTFSLWRGLGGRSFAPAVERPGATRAGDFAVADFDADGFDDVAITVSWHDGTVRHSDAWIRFGDAAGSLSDAHLVPNGGGSVADLDADGKPDLIGRYLESTWIFLNRWEGRPG